MEQLAKSVRSKVLNLYMMVWSSVNQMSSKKEVTFEHELKKRYGMTVSDLKRRSKSLRAKFYKLKKERLKGIRLITCAVPFYSALHRERCALAEMTGGYD